MQKRYPWTPVIVLLLASVLIHIGLSVPATAQTDPEESPGILLGAHIPPVDPSFGPNRLYYWQEIEVFNQLVGRRHPIIMYYSDLTIGLEGYLFDQFKDHLDPPPVPYVQMDPVPNIELWDIVDGLYDTQLRASAQGVKDFGKPIIIGFAHEFNETYSPFFGDPAAYIAAWRHVHRIFTQAGATNVQWLWPPNYKSDRPDAPMTDYNLYYPGDDYVDWIGVYGFNWGNDFTKGPGWVEFDYLFDEFLRNTACRYDKPLMVGPTGSVDLPGSKTDWITNIYRGLAEYPNVRAVVWFNDFAYNNPDEADFRVTVTTQYGSLPGPMPYYTAAYRSAISAPTYLTEFPGYAEIKPAGRSCFTLRATPRAVLLEWGDRALVQVIVDQAPIFDKPVNITVAGAPEGVRYAADPPVVSPDAAGAIVELQASEGTPPGTYTLTISAEAEGMIKSTSLSVAVVEEAHRTYLPLVSSGTAP